MDRVNFQAIEKKWQTKFESSKLYNKKGKKFYFSPIHLAIFFLLF